MGTARKPVLVRSSRHRGTCRICRAPYTYGDLIMSASAHPASWVHVWHLIHSSGVQCPGPVLHADDGPRCVPHDRAVYGTGQAAPRPGPRR